MKKQRGKKYDTKLGVSRQLDKQPAFPIDGTRGVPEQKAPHGMGPDELSYRMMLQEAILWVTGQVMKEHADEIKKRAEDRVRTLMELRA